MEKLLDDIFSVTCMKYVLELNHVLLSVHRARVNLESYNFDLKVK